MSLLAPLFLLGLAAIALPLWLHRLQTQSSDRKPFSSAMLLETAKQQVHVRRKLKYIALLCLRVLLLALVALAFAKPFLEREPDVVTSTDAGTHIVLVDTSASMQTAGVFEQAKAEARRAISDAPADALLQVVAADRALRVASELGTDKSAHVAAIAALQASDLRLDYGEAMTAVERLSAGLPQPVTLHFVSDFQASGMPSRFADLIPAGVSQMLPHVTGTGEPVNWSFEYVRSTADGMDAGLRAYGDRERVADVALIANDSVIDTQSLSGTGPHNLQFAAPVYAEGENRITLRITADDDLAVDNRWFHVIDNEPPMAIPIVTTDVAGLPMIYLSAALESSGEYKVEPVVADDFDVRILGRYRWLVVDDIGAVGPALENALVAYLENGGNLLAFAGDRAAGLDRLPVSAHRLDAASPGLQDGDFLTVSQLDSRHPVLTQTEGWQSVTISRSLSLQAGADDQVLMRLSNNEPFLLERRVGKGRLMLLPASLDNRWNDLPVRPVFVSFIIEAGRYLSGLSQIEKTYTAGASLPLGAASGTSGQVIDPDGNNVLSLADTTRDQQIKLDKPGFYEVYTSQGQTVVAVNVDPRESDPLKVSQETLDRWQAATAGQTPSGTLTYRAEQTETVALWHWVLLILGLVVIAESVLGNMHLTARRMERA